jgi:hypothetical protein
MPNSKTGGEYASGRFGGRPEKWTGVRRDDPGLGLFRRQAERHGMQTDAWGQEPQRDTHPSFSRITSAMNPGKKGKGARGFDFSNMQPRRGR